MSRNTDPAMNIPFARPSIGEEEIAAVSRVLRSGWLTTGAETLAFEKEFAAFVGSPHAMAVNSATAGLHLALEATGTRPGDVVIVPSLTFTATAEVARYLGAEVRFADVADLANGTLLIDPAEVDRIAAEIVAAGKRVSAVIVVHLAGAVAAVADLKAITKRYGAVLIEDAAHSFPSMTPEGYAGTLGDVGVFSFYANKTITTGEGGMVCTASPDVAERIRTMRLHGINREAWDRFNNPQSSWQYDVVAPGYKYNMPDTAAALGRVQLGRAITLLEARQRVARRYITGLQPLAERGVILLPQESPGHAWHLFILQVTAPAPARNTVARLLQEAGIGISVHYTPLHRLSYWRDRYGEQSAALPRTEHAADRILSLPLYPDLTAVQQDYILAELRRILDE